MSRSVDVHSLLAALKIPVVRQAGTAIWCCCPLHGERTPSWFIRDNPGDSFHGSSHCYGCGWSGFPVQLVQRLLALPTQREAYLWLVNMPAVEQSLPRRIEVVSVPLARALARPEAVWVPMVLADWQSRYLDYLLEDRHLTEAQVRGWGLGYVERDSASELADRVYLPAEDAGGRLLSYTCRAVGNAKRRYREPHRAEGANDAAILGELRWPSLPKDVVVVVEGGFNGYAAERASPIPVAFGALMGSSLHPLQVLKLANYPRVLLATDPDKAGEKAAIALRGALARYTHVEQLPIPVGHDCDSLPVQQLRDLLGRALQP